MSNEKTKEQEDIVEEMMRNITRLLVCRAAQELTLKLGEMSEDERWRAMHGVAATVLTGSPAIPKQAEAQLLLVITEFFAHKGNIKAMHDCMGHTAEKIEAMIANPSDPAAKQEVPHHVH
jgi:hypothetical protein